jgi:signal transduction histidine kinase
MGDPVAAAISFFALGANLLGTVLLLLFNPRNREVRWFTAFQLAIITWLFAQAMAYSTGKWSVWGWPHMVAVTLLPGLFLAAALAEDARRPAKHVWVPAACGLLFVPVMLLLVRADQWYWSGLNVIWQVIGWGAGSAIMTRRSLPQTPSQDGARSRKRITLLALLLLVPAAVIAALLIGSTSFFIYAMPLLTVAVQVLIFVGVARMRFYDIDVRVRRTGEVAAQLAESERLAVLGELAATLAHEVRNPLTGMRSLTQRIADEDVGPEKRRRYAEVILEEVGRLERIVSNLLGVARRTARLPRDPQPTALGPLFEDLQLLVGGSARAAQLTLRSEASGLQVQAPREALTQALLNLLLNAVRHAPPGSTVQLLARADSGGTELLVRDAGPGILPAERDRIFEPFQSSSNGTGLGLSVVRTLARELGWTLRVGDAPGGGAEFTIRVPAAAPTAAAASA